MTLIRLTVSAFVLAATTIPCSAASVPFGASVVDFGAPTSFFFTFVTPYVGGPYDSSHLEYSLTLTDGGRDGATATGLLEGYVDSVLASALPISCSVPVVDGVEHGSQVCTGSISQLFASPVTGSLEAKFNFALLGGDDNVSITGLHELKNSDSSEVPEPSAAVFGVTGIAALAVLGRRGLRRSN